jgi:hypothetical protein
MRRIVKVVTVLNEALHHEDVPVVGVILHLFIMPVLERNL